MTETKVIDTGFVTDLGNQIEKLACDSLKVALDKARESQEHWMKAGAQGGILATIACLFAAEYAENSWDRKLEEAKDLNKGAQEVVKNWNDTTDKTTVKV